jgi:hypothetical protein
MFLDEGGIGHNINTYLNPGYVINLNMNINICIPTPDGQPYCENVSISQITQGLFEIIASQGGSDNYSPISKTVMLEILENTSSRPAKLNSREDLKNFLKFKIPKYYKMSQASLDNALSDTIQFKLDS